MARTIDERLDRLASLTPDERQALVSDVEQQFQDAETAGDMDGMRAAIAIVERIGDFESLLDELDAQNIEVDESLTDEGDEPAAETVDAPEDESKDDQATKTEDAPSEAEADKTPETTEDEAPAETETVDAAENTPEASAEGTTESEVTAMAAAAVTPGSEDERTANPVAVVASVARAGVDVDGYVPGEALRSPAEDIADAMVKRINATAGMGDGMKSVVASLRADIPAERQLDTKNTELNQQRIDAVTDEQAIVASGGFCAPLPVNYDIFGVGSTARPVRDSLPTFGAVRGGIRYIQPPVLGSYTGAIALWTAINDQNPTNPATKPVLKVNCANELTASTDAITLSLEFGNLMTRAFPELVQRHNQLALIEHARFAEKTLLAKISALSTKVTVPTSRGTARDLLSAVTRASAQYRNRHRILRGVRLRLLMPDWTLDAIREDIGSNVMVGREDINISDSEVENWFDTRGFKISWYMDDTFEAQTAGGALNGWPSTIKFWLFAEGTLLFLDGGTLDLGVIRDAELVSTNDYVTFVETFEGVAKVGIEVLEVSAATGIGTQAPIVTQDAV